MVLAFVAGLQRLLSLIDPTGQPEMEVRNGKATSSADNRRSLWDRGLLSK